MTRMPVALILLSLTALSVASAQETSSQSPAVGFVNTLMPQPSQLSAQEGRLVITPSFTTITDHFKDSRLNKAITRSLGRIKDRTGAAIPTSAETDTASATLVISVEGPGAAVQSVDEDESYSLEITSTSSSEESPSQRASNSPSSSAEYDEPTSLSRSTPR